MENLEMVQFEQPLEISKAADRRDSTRVGFAAVVKVNDSGEYGIPASSFYPVTAQDLSHSGLSFTTDRWPQRDNLTLMMGSPDNPVYVNARIVRCVTEEHGDDPPNYTVHCVFAEWLS
jgi:hypothetical protein